MVLKRDRPRPMGDLAQLNQPVVRMMTFIAVAVVTFQVIYGVVAADPADW